MALRWYIAKWMVQAKMNQHNNFVLLIMVVDFCLLIFCELHSSKLIRLSGKHT